MNSEKLIEALKRIADIENKDVGSDWEEIEEAREIANGAIAAWKTRAPAQDSGDLPEATGFMWQHDGTGRVGFIDAWQVKNGWQHNNPRNEIIGPAYSASNLRTYGEKKRQEGIAQGRASMVPLRIEYEPGYPEDVAFGSQRQMDRLKKWLDKFFAMRAAQPSAPAVPEFAEKFFAWFNTPNPLLGDVAPLTMLKLGRGERLGKFIEGANRDLLAAAPQPPTSNSVEFDGIKTPRPQVELTDANDGPAWKKLFRQVALDLNCLPSTFVDANQHVLRASAAIAEARAKSGRA